MRDPAPPFLIFGFYFAGVAESVALHRLTDALASCGATLTGSAFVHRGEQLRDRPFASIRDLPQEEVALESLEQLHRLFDHADVRVVEVAMEGATGVMRGVAEIVAYESISDEASQRDHHPLAISTDGTAFSHAPDEPPAAAAEVGRRAYERFRKLVELLRPTYASITIEEALECPTDLRRDPRSLAFLDFYMSSAAVESSAAAALFDAAYCEPLAGGVYVSTTRWFNPLGENVESVTAQSLSVSVAKLIAEGSADR